MKIATVVMILFLLPACMDMFIDGPEMKKALASGDPEQRALLINERSNDNMGYSD